MPSRKVICPACGKSDLVEKVSTLYLAGIAAARPSSLKKSEVDDSNQPDKILIDIPVQELRALGRKLAPPASGKAVTRPVHPDIVVITFSCIVPIFLAGILAQQRPLFFPALVILACLYGFYLIKRKAIISRYEADLAAKREAKLRVERGIKTWMKLYYCSQDDGVFLPGEQELIPVDRMIGYLLTNQ